MNSLSDKLTRLHDLPGSPEQVRNLLAIPTLIGSLDMTMITAFIASIAVTLNENANAMGKIVTGYLFTYTLSLFLVGRISDYIGRRRMFEIAVSLYVIGSVIVFRYQLFSIQGIDHLTIILIGRAITGAGAGAFPALAISTMVDFYPKPLRAISFFGAIDVVGILAGGLYGALIIQLLPSWQYAFLLSACIGVLCFFIIRRVLPSRSLVKGNFDWGGALTLSITFLGIILSIVQLESPDSSIASLQSIAEKVAPFLLIGLIAFIAFFVLESRLKSNQLLDFRVFRQTAVLSGLLVTFLSSISLFTMLVGLPLLATINQLDQANVTLLVNSIEIKTLNQAAIWSGVLVLQFSGALALATIVGARLHERIGAASTVITGLIVACIGFGLLVFAISNTKPSDDNQLIFIGLVSIICGTGLGLVYSPVFDKPLAATSNPSMMAILLLAIRMAAGTCILSILAVLTQSRIDYLFYQAELPILGQGFLAQLGQKESILAKLPLDTLERILSPTFVRVSIQTIAEIVLFALACCAIALFPALQLRQSKSK